MAESAEVEVVPEAGAPSVKELTANQARKLTDKIKTSVAALPQLVTEAFEGQAWKALGHDSWKDYVNAEFEMTYENAWKLVLQGQAQRTLTEVAGAPVEVSARTVQAIGAKQMPAFMAKVREQAEAAPEGDRFDVVGRVVTDELEALRARKLPSGAPRVQVQQGQPRVMIPTWIQGVWSAVQKVAAGEGVEPTDWVTALILAQPSIVAALAEEPTERPKRGARARQSSGAQEDPQVEATVPEGHVDVQPDVQPEPQPASPLG